MPDRIESLYLNLAAALNALDDAGEDIFPVERFGELRVTGDSGSVVWDKEVFEWKVTL